MQLQQKLKQLEEEQTFVRILEIDKDGDYTTAVGVIDFDEDQDDIIYVESIYTSKTLMKIKEIQSIEVMTEVWNKADECESFFDELVSIIS